MAQLFEELKRRNVFRVGIAYAIVGWLLIEVASVLLPTFEAPNWVMQAFSLLVILGLPITLVIAWAFELTPEGIQRDTGVDSGNAPPQQSRRKLDFVIFGVLVIAVAYFAMDKFALNAEPVTPIAEPVLAAKPVAVERSIAVLPFVNMSSDPEQEYFSDGISEELLNLLSKIPGLKVIGRTSSFAFKGKNEDLRTIGQVLDVSTVLEGSVRKSGDRVRVTAQLIDVSNGAHLWSETYDRTLTDIFSVQDDVASAIIEALQIHVSTAPTRGRPTENPDAYALFLRGRDAVNRYDGASATQFLLKAVELDPMYAKAHELLAFSYLIRNSRSLDAVEALKGVNNSAKRALALDPSLVFAQALLLDTEVEVYTLQSIELFERAAASGGSNQWEAADSLAFVLLGAGYFQEALGVIERFVASDPLSPATLARLANALEAVGRRDEALAALKLADQLGSKYAKPELFHFYLDDKRDEIAISTIEAFLKEDEAGIPTGWVRDLVAGGRDSATGQAHLDRRIPEIVASMPEVRSFEISIMLVRLYLTFGFLDRFFELLDELGTTTLKWNDAEDLIVYATIKRQSGFTTHPRYLEVAEKYLYGMVSLWDLRGPPDFCEKLDGQWICE